MLTTWDLNLLDYRAFHKDIPFTAAYMAESEAESIDLVAVHPIDGPTIGARVPSLTTRRTR